MLSKIVVNIYSTLLEIGLWLLLIVSLIAGWQFNGVLGAVGGLIVAAIFGAVFFGAFLVLSDIRNAVRNLEKNSQD